MCERSLAFPPSSSRNLARRETSANMSTDWLQRNTRDPSFFIRPSFLDELKDPSSQTCFFCETDPAVHGFAWFIGHEDYFGKDSTLRFGTFFRNVCCCARTECAVKFAKWCASKEPSSIMPMKDFHKMLELNIKHGDRYMSVT